MAKLRSEKTKETQGFSLLYHIYTNQIKVFSLITLYSLSILNAQTKMSVY
jgi:hypothetical protein